ncbi:hypothetical protein FA15DRAFT_252250 [Coprinopsis marcescibilis]|uniref:Uncharacterized protein n=1 Tax=Coprinopsis marcescibilis TaxID=230819 RepID=A0A5C3KEH8_COPMA|nr:hypothetical protein FA15DRAFT_252250 [Coprinopsis marcescibilis]
MCFGGLVWWESGLASGAMYIPHKGSCSHRVNRCSSFFVRCPCDFFGYFTPRGLVSYPIPGSCWSGRGMWWCDRAMRRGHVRAMDSLRPGSLTRDLLCAMVGRGAMCGGGNGGKVCMFGWRGTHTDYSYLTTSAPRYKRSAGPNTGDLG